VVEVVNGVADVVVDEVGVHRDGVRGTGTCRGDDLGAWVDDVAGGPDPGHAGASGGVDVDVDPAMRVSGATEAEEKAVVGDEAWRHETARREG
jgi:hypothetical protein